MLDVQINIDERPFSIFARCIAVAEKNWKPEAVQAFIKAAQAGNLQHLMDVVKATFTLYYIDIHGARLPWPPP